MRPTASPLYLLGATKVAPRDPWSPVFFTLTQLSQLSAKPNHHENIFPWVVVKQVVDSHSIHRQAYSYLPIPSIVDVWTNAEVLWMFDSIQYFTQMLVMNGHLPAELNFRENTAKSSVIPSSNMLAVSFYHQVNSAELKSYLFFFLPPHICPCL